MAERTHAPGRPFAQSLALQTAVLGLIVGSATLLVATQRCTAPDDGVLAACRIGVLPAAFPGPFLLALASFHLREPTAQRMV